MAHHAEHDRAIREIQWQQSSGTIKRLMDGGVEKHVSELRHISEAFGLHDRCVNCIDEGTTGGIHMAGSGILLPEADACRAALAAKIDGVSSHEGCGAAMLYAVQNGFDPADADRLGQEWAQKLAKLTGKPYRGHKKKGMLHRPPDMHNARVTYYDGTGKFDNSLIAALGIDLPPGFVISRRYLPSAEYAKTEAKVSFDIATGDHGFGDLITPDEPFIIIPIGDPDNTAYSLDVLSKELEQLEVESGGRLIVSGFSAQLAREAAA